MTRYSDNAERRPGRARIVTRRSFHRPGWTCFTRTRRPARPTGGNLRFWPVICAATAARVSEASGAIAWWMVTFTRASTPLENFSGSAASRPSPGRSSCRNTRPGRSRRGATHLYSSQHVDRQNTYCDPQPARRPPQTGPRWPRHPPQPRKARVSRHEHQAAPAAQREPGWRHESEDARQATRAVEVMPGDAVESRGALFLGRLPFSANRM